MVSDKHGLKDRLAGSLKELQGKVTKNKPKELGGKLQKARGKAKNKVQSLKGNLKNKRK